MDIVLNRRLGPGHLKRLEFVETESERRREEELGLKEFLRDRSLSGDANDTPLYYYRQLQNLRDPLNFRERGAG
jgi:hypothetical protein